MAEVNVKIKNKLGLHARPAAEFVKLATKFKSDVYISKNDRVVNGKSIMGVMTLAAEMGSKLLIQTIGEDENEALNALIKLIDDKFNEE